MVKTKKMFKKSITKTLPYVFTVVLLLGLFVSFTLTIIPTVKATETNMIGCNTIGTYAYSISSDSLWFSSYTLTGTGGNLSHMGLYFSATTGTANVYLSMYYPNRTFIAHTTEITTVDTTPSWHFAPFTTNTSIPTGNYYLSLQCDKPITVYWSFSGVLGQVVGSYPSFPNNPTLYPHSAMKISIYANLTTDTARTENDVICLGDSITLGNSLAPPYPQGFEMRTLLGTTNAGYYGATSGVVRNYWFDQYRNNNYSYMSTLMGVNDLWAGYSSQEVKSNLQTIWLDAIQNVGVKTVFAFTVMPCKGYAGGWDDARQANLVDVNNFILNASNINPKIHPINIYTLLENKTNPAYLNSTYDAGDGLHPNQECANLIADQLFLAYQQVLGSLPQTSPTPTPTVTPTPTPSTTPTPTIEPTSTPSPTVTPTSTPTTYDNGKTCFIINSNSTVSAVNFQSIYGVLDFKVSGETGTTGYVNVSVSKTILSSTDQLRTYIDTQQKMPLIQSDDEYYYIQLTYSHSSHTIQMSFFEQPKQLSYNQFSIELRLISLALLVLIFLVAVVVIKNKSILF